ncbi:MAG TPA: PEP-CTERM sorting domain-containing protein [Myxococcales bacterium]|nr:PEP-CTERM sorting domain-containing protein [Myxococcales bacterium]HIK85964.1 PEP-CTERM sorting domain-containing protein [Myxococcales bacterium]
MSFACDSPSHAAKSSRGSGGATRCSKNQNSSFPEGLRGFVNYFSESLKISRAFRTQATASPYPRAYLHLRTTVSERNAEMFMLPLKLNSKCSSNRTRSSISETTRSSRRSQRGAGRLDVISGSQSVRPEHRRTISRRRHSSCRISRKPSPSMSWPIRVFALRVNSISSDGSRGVYTGFSKLVGVVTGIPEPSSAIMMMLGLAGLTVAGRSRSSKTEHLRH